MRLTTSEKNHWRDRISNRFGKAIEELYRQAGPNFKAQIRQRSEQRFLQLHDLQEEFSARKKLQQQIDALREERSAIGERAEEKLQGHDFNSRRLYRNDLEQLVETEARNSTNEVLKEFEVGRRILQLQDEKDQLLDTVWLATSSVQIRTLWQDMMTILGESSTELQQQALTYPPAKDSDTE